MRLRLSFISFMVTVTELCRSRGSRSSLSIPCLQLSRSKFLSHCVRRQTPESHSNPIRPRAYPTPILGLRYAYAFYAFLPPCPAVFRRGRNSVSPFCSLIAAFRRVVPRTRLSGYRPRATALCASALQTGMRGDRFVSYSSCHVFTN